MDTNRFDTIAKALASPAMRRRTLSLFLGAALGLAELPGTDAAKSGNCKPQCGPCATCNKGKCKKKKNGKKKCQKGTCEPAPNDALCNGTGRCLNGTCNDLPLCAQFGVGCSTADPGTCCSDICVPLMMVAACSLGPPGRECIANTDCVSGSCVGFRCQ